MNNTARKLLAGAPPALLTAALGLTLPTQAMAAHDGWHFGVGTGLRSLNLDGDIGFATANGGVIADVDLDNGDTADMFESAFGLAGFAAKGPWKFSAGAATLTLEDKDAGLDAEWDRVQAHAEVEYTFAMVGKNRFGVLGGVRYNDHDWRFKNQNTSESSKAEEDWTDAVIGATHALPFAENWTWVNRADYGFGGSEGTFHISTGANWKPFNNWVFNGSVSYMDVEYGDKDDINDSDFYYYDAKETTIGLAFMYVW